MTDVVNPKSYYEVVEVKVKTDLNDLYWKIARYAGEEMFLQLENDKINIWEGEISEFQEYWGTFDEIEEIEHISYELYTLEKNADDWKSDYEKLRKNYHALYGKKIFQLKEYRLAILEEFKDKIDTRIKHLKDSGLKVDDRIINQVHSALNDKNSGLKISSVVDFIFE
ncbi:hypothetical protein [Algibacter sp. L4_22]|uniref:hypothetical protein n=1 Tax=Algibacter sp. L4_22 TaxID=2942477 RepID=UPI00201B732F|nr:hypothetical protein [Algibacter sp. L4_22]MCL5130553.1 hypothetical protein [Algibacter sp. L4_22]